MNKRKIIYFVFFISLFSSVFSQTEKDYYEWIRRHNETRKIKRIMTDYYTDYIDEKGYHYKRDFGEGSFVQINWLEDGNLLAEINNSEGTFKMNGSPALLYEQGFDAYNITDRVELIFDSSNRLVKKNISAEGNFYDNENYYYELLKNYPSRSERYSDGKLINTIYYKYDGKGILLNESLRDEYSGKTYFFEYKYEFYE
jgi:hypothetical protein